MFLFNNLFDPNKIIELNTYYGSFLNDDGSSINQKFIDKFNTKYDIVMGNPPYNWSGNGNQRRNNRENLWTRFVFNGFDILNENGFLCFVTPKSWMSPSADYGRKSIFKDIFKVNNPIYINIDKCSRFFSVGSTFSYYTIQKSKNSKKTIIETSDNKFEMDLTSIEDIPVLIDENSLSISSKFFSEKYDKFEFKQSGVITRREKFYDVPTDEYVNETFHTKSKNKVYSRYISDNKNVKKVMICLSGMYEAIVDDGKISQTNMNCVYPLKKDERLDDMKKLLNSKIYLFVMNKLFKYNGWVNMKCIYKLPKIKLSTYTDEEIYKYFNLTQEEIDLIENHYLALWKN